MRHFCTLFDKNYASRGLALHESLKLHTSEPFTLHVLCMDRDTFWLLDELKLDNVELMQRDSFERNMPMQRAIESRTWVEYLWTCASSACEYLMQFEGIDEITYLDADLFFFSDPRTVFDEIGQRSIAIVPHRFPPHLKRLEVNGIYNVGWVTFRENGMHCLRKWAAQCREWCFHRNEAGKFGDQKYLDHFERDYGKAVAVIENIGVGLAPWNISQYKVESLNWRPMVNGQDVVFYHFHEYKDAARPTNYPLRAEDKRCIYAPYIEALSRADIRLKHAQQRLNAAREAMAAQAVRA